MKKEEQIVQAYLKSEGLSDIVYEPEGNIPPDFSVSGRIGVEVRRLNENLLTSSKVEGLEQESNELYRCVENTLREYDESMPADSFWVLPFYKRPIGNLRQIRAKLKEEITTFLSSPRQTPYRFSVTNNLHITFVRATQQKPQPFLQSGWEIDDDSGGPLTKLYADNIQYCIEEKTRKIETHLARYCEWWLVLVDAIVGGVDISEGPALTADLNKPSEWKRILLIDPITLKRKLEF